MKEASNYSIISSIYDLQYWLNRSSVNFLQVRIKALNTLYQFPLSDELTSKNSEGIRKGLLAALADDDEQLAVNQ